MIKDFISLIYPELCYCCDEPLLKGEQSICTKCFINLPATDFHLSINNPLMKRFYGRVNIREAHSFLKFVKSGSVQKLMHKLKYEGKQEVGELLGKWYGRILYDSNKSYDIIVPVPMHKRKMKKRGYNQVDSIAIGLSHSLKTPWSSNVLSKITHTDSQTKKSRFNRWLNTKEVFYLANNEVIKNKNVLIVDDVVTTGATLEACANILLEEGSCNSVSIATIAIAI